MTSPILGVQSVSMDDAEVDVPAVVDADDAPKVDVATTRKEFIARIAERTGKRPNQMRDVVDAVLEELGEALSKSEKLKLPPLGVMSLNRKKEANGAEILICKLRRKIAVEVTTETEIDASTAAE